MDISLELPHSRYFVRRYQPGEIVVNETVYQHSIVLTESSLITDWPPQSIDKLTSQHLAILLAAQPEIILLGTGPKQIFPSVDLLVEVQKVRVGIEVMSTEAAARTFNILASEGRRVMAALML
jgi:uncharacterized protein